MFIFSEGVHFEKDLSTKNKRNRNEKNKQKYDGKDFGQIR